VKALVLAAEGLGMRNVVSPKPKEREVLLDVMVVGLCGSDIRRINASAELADKPPLVLGHEVTGSLGRKAGNAVVLPFIGFQKHVCKTDFNFAYLPSIGKQFPGGFQEKIALPSQNVIQLPGSLTPVEAILADPLAVIIHGIGRLGQMEGRNICIIGDGTLGILATRLLAKRNRVMLFGKRRHAISCAERNGVAGAFFTEMHRHREKFDLAIEVAGTEAALEGAFELARRAGTVLVYGAYPEGKRSLAVRNAFYKELTIVGSNSYGISDETNEFFAALKMLAERKIQVDGIITHVIPFVEANSIGRILADKEQEKAIKIVLTW